MKFYRLSWCEPGEGIRYAWHRNRRDAEQDARRVRAEWPETDPEDLDLEIRLEPVPTTKAKLLRWLNAHASRYCGEVLSMKTISPIQVGSQVIAKRISGVCDPGERGVCYQVYELAGRPGWSFIFESGRYDGFSPADVATFLEVTGEVCQEVADYSFTNVGQLCRDFQRGRFDPGFHVELETPPDTGSNPRSGQEAPPHRPTDERPSETEARIALLRARIAYYEQQPSLNLAQLARLSQYRQCLADLQREVSAPDTQELAAASEPVRHHATEAGPHRAVYVPPATRPDPRRDSDSPTEAS